MLPTYASCPNCKKSTNRNIYKCKYCGYYFCRNMEESGEEIDGCLKDFSKCEHCEKRGMLKLVGKVENTDS